MQLPTIAIVPEKPNVGVGHLEELLHGIACLLDRSFGPNGAKCVSKMMGSSELIDECELLEAIDLFLNAFLCHATITPLTYEVLLSVLRLLLPLLEPSLVVPALL